MSRNKLILLGIFLLKFTSSFAQIDSIYAKKNFSGTFYFKDKKRLTRSDFQNTIKLNIKAAEEYKISKKNNWYAFLFAISGSACAGWAMGSALESSTPNWALMGIGVGLYGISIPFSIQERKHKQQAIQIFNSGLK